MRALTEIKVKEHLDTKWEACFDGVTIRHVDNLTVLQVELKDQAHLHGILGLIRDLNLKLISINYLESG